MPVTLTERQRIPTTGARAVKSFEIDSRRFLAIPQLARDVAGEPAGMNAGASDAPLLVLEEGDGLLAPFAELAGPGGEDAEFFRIGDRLFLAVACIRTGSGPYEFAADSLIYEWNGHGFELFQSVSTFAAKQWRHWVIGDRHFLGLAQGLGLPHLADENRDSIVFEWVGGTFVPFQSIPSRWAYNWHPFRLDNDFFVAHADHTGPSILYRWDGSQLVRHQELLPLAGRAFAHLVGTTHFLLATSITEPPVLLRWNGERFEPTQVLSGAGGRELRLVEVDGRTLVVRINFITGTPADPEPNLTSQVYEWADDDLRLLAEFPTIGGTDAEVVASGSGGVRLAVSNGLSPDCRFASETVIYDLRIGEDDG